MKKRRILKTKLSTKTKQPGPPKQMSFFKPQKKFFGGALLYKKRKSARPLSSKDSIHFVLRSQWAMGRGQIIRRKKVNAFGSLDHSRA